MAMPFGRGRWALVVLAAATLVGMGIHSARGVLLPVLFGGVFAVAIQPLVNQLEWRGFPSIIAVGVGLVAMFLIFAAGSGTLIWGLLDLASELSTYQDALADMKRDIVLYLATHGMDRLALLVQKRVELDAGSFEVAPLVNHATELVGFATLAGLVSFFGLVERASFSRRLSSDRRVSLTWERILADTQRYLSIKSATSALTGLLASGACWFLDVPNAPLWGAIAFWLNFLPVVGSILAAIPPGLIALATKDVATATAVGASYLAINVTIGNYLEPKWQGAAAGLSALAVVISVAAWGALLGPLGALLAVPLTMTMKIWCYHTRDLSWVARVLGETKLNEDVEGEPRPSLFSVARERSDELAHREGEPPGANAPV